jgi:hypothetical protein
MRTITHILLLSAFASAAFAQGPPSTQYNPMSSWLRDAYMRNRSNIVRTAEKMPEEFFDMRPGAQPGSSHLRLTIWS